MTEKLIFLYVYINIKFLKIEKRKIVKIHKKKRKKKEKDFSIPNKESVKQSSKRELTLRRKGKEKKKWFRPVDIQSDERKSPSVGR